GAGAIVNVSSIASLAGDLVRTAYGSSKAALNVLTQYVATQYGRRGIRANVVVPGLTSTPNVRATVPPHRWAVYEREVLRPRANDAEDLANVVAFLASPLGAAVNGAVVHTDGGIMSHIPHTSGLEHALDPVSPSS